GFNGAAAVHRGRVDEAGPAECGVTDASMGPRLFTAEGWHLVDQVDLRARASMGPRLFTAEGKVTEIESLRSSLLQWGRGCSPRKGKSNSFMLGRCCRFNGAAAVHRGRG